VLQVGGADGVLRPVGQGGIDGEIAGAVGDRAALADPAQNDQVVVFGGAARPVDGLDDVGACGLFVRALLAGLRVAQEQLDLTLRVQAAVGGAGQEVVERLNVCLRVGLGFDGAVLVLVDANQDNVGLAVGGPGAGGAGKKERK